MKQPLFMLTIVMALSACNTIRGLGKDIETDGEAIQQSTK
ncbi:COG5510 Predicted small secreted protein [Methylophilaceae bacterium]|jgi:predicted small secreted protein